MARDIRSWFEFKERNSMYLGVRLLNAHAFTVGGARGAQEKVSGRSGYVWLSDGATEAFDIKCTCRAPASRLREVSAWLTGAGGLRFSGEMNAVYDARIVKAIEYRRAIPGEDPLYEFSVTFSCQPFARLWPESEPIVIEASGTELSTRGTAPALPRVEIVGEGAFSLTIGKQTMFFSGVEGGIVVDSELQDALTLDGSQLANDKVSGDFFEIQPGWNVVQWLEGGEDGEGAALPGSVTRVTIAPRWRLI